MSYNAKLLLPIGLGLSLVTVTAAVVYYVFKKDEDKTKEAVTTSRINVIEVDVPKSIVPALIGRSGSNIKEIEKKSGALINFKKFQDKDYDTCIIRGRKQATQLAETLVHDFISQQPVIVEDSMEVPSWACGRIIGTGGENINEISHKSGARVKIEGGMRDSSTQRMIMLRGTKEQIGQAKKLIDNCVAQEKCRREIEASKRSPRHTSTSSETSLGAPTLSGGAPLSAKGPLEGQVVQEGSDLPGERRNKYTITRHGRIKMEGVCEYFGDNLRFNEGAGAPIEVYVSAVSSPSRFWVQLVGPQVTQLDELVAHMTEYYGNKDTRDQHALTKVSVGQVVAAVFRHDGRWYRARVDDIRPNEFDNTQQVADVFYVDYGDSEYVAVHELCELRGDLLRLRFQAMECFLAGVSPAGPLEEVSAVSPTGQRWDRWPNAAVERFEELTQVAKWKPLVSRTCTYKKMSTEEGKEKEIPGIKLFDVTEAGELDIGAALIDEGLAVACSSSRMGSRVTSPRTSPPPPPFGDLRNSMVLGIRASSMPKDHKDDQTELAPEDATANKENEKLSTSKSVGSKLESGDEITSISNFDISYPSTSPTKPHNGTSDFLHAERQNIDSLRPTIDSLRDSTETLVPAKHHPIEELKANMNRIDSHHSLEILGQVHHDAK